MRTSQPHALAMPASPTSMTDQRLQSLRDRLRMKDKMLTDLRENFRMSHNSTLRHVIFLDKEREKYDYAIQMYVGDDVSPCHRQGRRDTHASMVTTMTEMNEESKNPQQELRSAKDCRPVQFKEDIDELQEEIRQRDDQISKEEMRNG